MTVHFIFDLEMLLNLFFIIWNCIIFFVLILFMWCCMMKYNLIQFYIASSDILSHYIFVDICDSRFSFIKSENDHIPAFLKTIFHFFLLNFILRSRRFITKKNLNLLKKILRTKIAKFYILFKYYTNLFPDIKDRLKRSIFSFVSDFSS